MDEVSKICLSEKENTKAPLNCWETDFDESVPEKLGKLGKNIRPIYLHKRRFSSCDRKSETTEKPTEIITTIEDTTTGVHAIATPIRAPSQGKKIY